MTDDDDVSQGLVADNPDVLAQLFPSAILQKYEIFSYRNAAGILKSSFPEHLEEIVRILADFEITRRMIRTPGGSKSDIARYVDTLFSDGWHETRISADLHVKLLHAKKKD